MADKQGSSCLSVDQVPDHFREMFILSGYRQPNSSLSQCLRSALSLNNETFNFWTHMLPGLYLIALSVYLCWSEFEGVNEPYPYVYPMITYLITLCIMPTISAVAHLFNTMSDRARHICFFLDYSALSLYSLGAAIAYNAYSMPTDFMGTTFAKLFVPIAIFNAVASMTVSSLTRFMKSSPLRKFMRISSYAIPYLFDMIPVIYRGLFGSEEDWGEGGLILHLRQMIFAALSAFLYCSHMPERLSPGTFDLFGHSHQIFHLTSVLGAMDQAQGFMLDLQERREYLASHTDIPSFGMTVLAMSKVGLINLIQLLVFAQFLHRILPDNGSDECATAEALNGVPIADCSLSAVGNAKDNHHYSNLGEPSGDSGEVRQRKGQALNNNN